MSDTPRSGAHVHVLGAGPVGLMLTALLQPIERFSVHLYEKRREYTRTRMVQLAPYLVADSVESYETDYIDGDTIAAVFEPAELDEGLAFRQSIPTDLMAPLREWAQGFCPLNAIERSLSDLIDARKSNPVHRTAAVVTAEDAIAMLEPGDILVDCTGNQSVLRDHMVPGSGDVEGANTLNIRLEYALVITFLYGQEYDCNEYSTVKEGNSQPYSSLMLSLLRAFLTRIQPCGLVARRPGNSPSSASSAVATCVCARASMTERALDRIQRADPWPVREAVNPSLSMLMRGPRPLGRLEHGPVLVDVVVS